MASAKWESPDWYTNIVLFRSNNRYFIQKYFGSEEECLRNILQTVFNESVSDSVKLHLLGLIQEYAEQLLVDSSSLEEVVGSLQNLFLQKKSGSVIVLCNQIIVTCCNLLIYFDALRNQHLLLYQFIELLFDVISDVQKNAHASLRSTACVCLIELERRYAGLLTKKLEYLFQTVQLEKSSAAQAYMSLFTIVLKNTIVALTHLQEVSQPDKYITEALTNRVDLLKPFTLSEHEVEVITKRTEVGKHIPSRSHGTIARNVHIKELSRAISFLVHSLPYTTRPVRYHLLEQLTFIVKLVPTISPVVFKSVWLNNLSTFDILTLFCSVHQLELHEPLCTPADEERFLHHVILCLSHQSIPTIHKLIVSHWLHNWPVPRGNQLGFVINDWQLHNLYPTIFDSSDIHIAKLTLLSQILPARISPDEFSARLMGGVVPLLKPVQYGSAGRSASALYRVFYQFYTDQQDFTLARDIHRCILKIVMEHAKFVPHTVDFVQAVKDKLPDSNIGEIIYLPLVDHVVQADSDLCFEENLTQYLCILKEATLSPIFPARRVLLFLTDILRVGQQSTVFDWTVGHDLLDVCSSLRHRQTETDNFSALGDLLFLIISTYNDVDIKDRAKQYYAMLTCLSPKKVKSSLSYDSIGVGKTTIASIVEGSGYRSGYDSVTHMDEPVFRLRFCQYRSEDQNFKNCSTESNNVSLSGLISKYFEDLDNEEDGVKCTNLSYYVDIIHDAFEEVFAATFQFSLSDNFHPVEDLQVPFLKKNLGKNSQEWLSQMHLLKIKLVPKSPSSTSIHVRAIFMDKNGHSFMCFLDPLAIEFTDIRCPVTCLQGPTIFEKEQIFDAIWDYLDELAPESILVIRRTNLPVQKYLEKYFEGFVIHQKITEIAGEMVAKIGMCLPPKSNCLLCLTALGSDNFVFKIRSDDVNILPLLQEFLRSTTSV